MWPFGKCIESVFRTFHFFEAKALQMVIDYCFNEKGFTTLWGDYFPSNPASGRVMEKCGFVDTGEETLCPNLEVGSDCPVRVMKLIKK